MESVLITHTKPQQIDSRTSLLVGEAFNAENIEIPTFDLKWEHDFTESGDTITYYENKEEDIDLGEHLIRCRLKVSSINYGKNIVWVGELELWGEEDIIHIPESYKQVLRNKIKKSFL
ncbi:hypothetical protein [Flagellimonas sp. CMM7]|uniref:hypothetical protein n=1 Tax=Flagellimonas sp. CMM7 TaxID=2654676 RepID=UPI0013D7E034|nr:hypothetical protein [Flagellimonas sp. CMM7]UII80052.1 hypothetical protein LV704_00675 [Flagellimonas sp. CMM7]